MKKVFLLFLLLLLPVSCLGVTSKEQCEAVQNIDTNSTQLVRFSTNDTMTFIFLFPVNSEEFENVELSDVSLEGFKFYLKNYISLLQKEYQAKVEDIENAEVSKVEYFIDRDALGFQLKFNTLEAYQEYFEIDGDSNVDYKASGFFVKKYTYETAFPFSAASAASIKNLYNTCLNVWGSTFEIDIQKQAYLKDIFEDMTFTYQLISTSKTLRSENFESEGGLFYNTFTKSQAELEENPNISLYLFYISRGWWYLLALVVTLICVLVAFLILKKKRKKA